ncbi:hypothetical protein DAPPUDRAFT_260814 [Daphnia pulex]|uniref:Uncharacterized protein n=1 Tax=Daphnia pulex TaxID=6669 RepID=E9HJY2_DAPPU|nr:hypothetical protein DAPPUDRAFT_260814 [Daphnia pulex]|eukprot:EFX67960.1 hypothetical protein DAPPUDRAFT_260814 [Daphnia pulex]
MNKTNKAKIFKILEDRVKHQPPTTTDVVIIDLTVSSFYISARFAISIWKIASSYSSTYMCIPSQDNSTIHLIRDLIFDRVTSPSIKDMERDKSTDSDRDVPFKKAGDNQLRPIDFITD